VGFKLILLSKQQMDNMDDFNPDIADTGADPFAATGGNDDNGDDDPFGSSFAPDIDNEGGDSDSGGGGDSSAFGFVGGDSSSNAPISMEPAVAASSAPAEESALSKWKEQREVVLRERRDKAREEKERQQEIAKGELETMHSQRKARLEAVKKQNREEEKNWHSEMTNTMEFGSDWEKVTKLVNLTTPKGEKPGSSKVDRMRALLIQLKNEKK